MLFSKKFFIVIFCLLALTLIFLFGLGLWVKSKKVPAKIMSIEQVERKTVDPVFKNLPVEILKKMEDENKKVRTLTGKIDKIQGRVLSATFNIGDLKGKTYEINVLPDAKFGKTEVDKITFIPKTVDLSFDEIKVNDEIIAWAKQEDIKNLKQFDTEYLEVMVK
ncbi:hypothetical protein KKC67_01165 [Patescibacteria group bacterium]|nr:hypothetical protein [Patescibacteria group bacterium]MBU0879345.1 hypothetical protein [Patescibacteria group bacterium]MBU0880210.1 hypothetical protein [Patescibacteria group bacterium]MBU0897579.1 hypothetical protein [Patescibacteria group bacterium]MBU1062691.1 hypothetical protein [Patescibacteria group bacterium]